MEYRHPSPASQTGPVFDVDVTPNGYAWWYVDGRSDCGEHGITVIAMLGCVFSPWYARARRTGPTNPLAHCALNVVLYGREGRRWAMTERDTPAVQRSAQRLAIGPSRLKWDDGVLTIDVDERTAPWHRPLRGRIRVRPHTWHAQAFELDSAGRHRWWPLAPRARIEVDFDAPARCFEGDAYLDGNHGDEPLEAAFEGWQWARASDPTRTLVFYDARDRLGKTTSIAIDTRAGSLQAFLGSTTPVALPPSSWGIARTMRADVGTQPVLIKTLESAPFYARSWVRTQLDGHTFEAFHETLSMRRFTRPWVQALLPVRLPRRVDRAARDARAPRVR